MKPWVKVTAISCIGFSFGFGCIYYFLAKNRPTTAESTHAGTTGAAEVEWSTLRELDVKSGRATAKLAAFDGANVRIPGFIVPLEDNDKSVSDFLLVPSPQACIHVPPPPPNQMVHVRMASGTKASLSYGPVWVHGRLRVAETTGPYGKTSYEMVGEFSEPYH